MPRWYRLTHVPGSCTYVDLDKADNVRLFYDSQNTLHLAWDQGDVLHVVHGEEAQRLAQEMGLELPRLLAAEVTFQRVGTRLLVKADEAAVVSQA